MTTPFVTVPDPMANFGTVIASITALKLNMNLLIVNSQPNAQAPNLTGANIFSQVAALQKQVAVLANDVANIQAVFTKNGIG